MKATAELLDLSGKVAVVTGGSRGIGRAVAEGFAVAGADVVIASRKLENCKTAAAEIEAATRRRVLPVGCHVGRWQDAEVLVHAVNARGPFRLSALFGTRMAEGDGGSIINVTTAGTLRPDATDLPYAMAKAGLNALTLALAGAWTPKVRANLVMPGAFDTDISKAWGPENQAIAAAANPMKRIGVPEDMAALCVFLAS